MTPSTRDRALADDEPVLRVAIGATSLTRALMRDGPGSNVGFSVDFADVEPVNRAFAPMVRECCYDLSELALVTAIQAKAFGKQLVMLPIVLAARFQEPALLCRADDDRIRGPADLVEKKVGVRAYGQTTAVWLRGILDRDHGVKPDAVRWVTFEGAHVAEAVDPLWADRAPPGADMLAMLRARDLDAVIVGNDPPGGADLRTVFPDPDAAAHRFLRRYGFKPVNHLLVARRALVESRPDLLVGFVQALAASKPVGEPLVYGRELLQLPVELAIRFADDQGLLPRAIGVDELWDSVPPELLDPQESRS